MSKCKLQTIRGNKLFFFFFFGWDSYTISITGFYHDTNVASFQNDKYDNYYLLASMTNSGHWVPESELGVLYIVNPCKPP